MLGGEPRQHVDVGREAGLRLLDALRRELEAIEQDLAQLDREPMLNSPPASS
jgi:hypothetical protein